MILTHDHKRTLLSNIITAVRKNESSESATKWKTKEEEGQQITILIIARVSFIWVKSNKFVIKLIIGLQVVIGFPFQESSMLPSPFWSREWGSCLE